jgi:calcineurin-like phosphoesterase family protein
MIITEETFIIGDSHFGHENILRHEPVRKQRLGSNPDIWSYLLNYLAYNYKTI